jgi:predicted HNH restriction endonuclease
MIVLQQVSNVKLERNAKNIYTQKNAEHVNEFCRWCNASLKVTYGDTHKSVSIVNLLKPTAEQDSFEVLLQNIGIVCERGPEWSERLCGTCIKIKCAF